MDAEGGPGLLVWWSLGLGLLLILSDKLVSLIQLADQCGPVHESFPGLLWLYS